MTWDDGEPTIGRVFTPKLEALLGPARQPDGAGRRRGTKQSPRRCRSVFEEAAMHVLSHVRTRARARTAAVPRRRLRDEQRRERQDPRADAAFDEVYIQPAAGDNGTALGAAFDVWHQPARRAARFRHGARLLGPRIRPTAQIAAALDGAARDDRRRRMQRVELFDAATMCVGWTAKQIADGRVVGWFQGRMEWGARALGNRSILADPRRADMRDIINTRDQVPRAIPAVRAVGARRGARRILRRRGARSVHAAGLSGPAREARGRARPSRTSTARVGCRRSAARTTRATGS